MKFRYNLCFSFEEEVGMSSFLFLVPFIFPFYFFFFTIFSRRSTNISLHIRFSLRNHFLWAVNMCTAPCFFFESELWAQKPDPYLAIGHTFHFRNFQGRFYSASSVLLLFTVTEYPKSLPFCLWQWDLYWSFIFLLTDNFENIMSLCLLEERLWRSDCVISFADFVFMALFEKM